MERVPRLKYSVSATTRKPRPGEIEGVHYFFRTMDQFEIMIRAGELVEYMLVHGNYYGTPKTPLDAALAEGYGIILDLDVYGKVNFDRHYPEAIGILITPPSIEELERRLVARNQDDPDTIRLRLRNAVDELEFAKQKGKYEYCVVNDDFQRSLEELTGILEKEMGSLLHLPNSMPAPGSARREA